MAKVIDKMKVYENVEINTEIMVNNLFKELGICFDEKKSTIIIDGKDADLNDPVYPESTIVVTPNIYNG